MGGGWSSAPGTVTNPSPVRQKPEKQFLTVVVEVRGPFLVPYRLLGAGTWFKMAFSSPDYDFSSENTTDNNLERYGERAESEQSAEAPAGEKRPESARKRQEELGNNKEERKEQESEEEARKGEQRSGDGRTT